MNQNEIHVKNSLLNLYGEFTWDFGCHFFIETEIGNFVWSDPTYNGDNTMVKFSGTLNEWLDDPKLFGRSKGIRPIGGYCGDEFVVSLPTTPETSKTVNAV